MAGKVSKSRKTQASPPKIDPGGDVRVAYKKPVETGNQPVVLSDLVPEGKLEVRKEYALKDGWFARIIARIKGPGPNGVAMVQWQKGQLKDDRTLEWYPVTTGIEKQVETFIDNYAIKGDKE